MKWITHEAVAVGAAFALGAPPAALAGTFAGSVMPDVVDQRIAGLFQNRQRAFNRIHRGATHWFGWWLALWILGLFWGDSATESFFFSALREIPGLDALFPNFIGTAPAQKGILRATQFAAGLGFGGIMHVVLDMCTVSGVPIVPWSRKRKISLKLFSTGSYREYLFLAAAMLLLWLIKGEHIMQLLREARRALFS